MKHMMISMTVLVAALPAASGQSFEDLIGEGLYPQFWGIHDWIYKQDSRKEYQGTIGLTNRLSGQMYDRFNEDPKVRLAVASDLITSQCHTKFYQIEDDPKVVELMRQWREKYGPEHELIASVRNEFPADFRNPYLLQLVNIGREYDKKMSEIWKYFDTPGAKDIEGMRRHMQEIEIGAEIMEARLQLIEPADDVVAAVRRQIADLRATIREKRGILAEHEAKIIEDQLTRIEPFLDQYEKKAAQTDGAMPTDRVMLSLAMRLEPKFHAERVKAAQARVAAMEKVWEERRHIRTLDRLEEQLKQLEEATKDGKTDRARLVRLIERSKHMMDRQLEALPADVFPERQKSLRERAEALKTPSQEAMPSATVTGVAAEKEAPAEKPPENTPAAEPMPTGNAVVELQRLKSEALVREETAMRLRKLEAKIDQYDDATKNAVMAIYKICSENGFLSRVFEPAELTVLALNHHMELLKDPRLESDDAVEKLEGTEAVRLRKEGFKEVASGGKTDYLMFTLLEDIDLTSAFSRVRCDAYFKNRALKLATMWNDVSPDQYESICNCVADKMFPILVETKGNFKMKMVDHRFLKELTQCRQIHSKP